jgi:DNA-directed RNA polymerase specialized sigma24 family protein
LNDLRERDREILLAVDPDSEESWREIGERLKISANVAKERYFRAKQRLCRRYAELGTLGAPVSLEVVEDA